MSLIDPSKLSEYKEKAASAGKYIKFGTFKWKVKSVAATKKTKEYQNGKVAQYVNARCELEVVEPVEFAGKEKGMTLVTLIPVQVAEFLVASGRGAFDGASGDATIEALKDAEFYATASRGAPNPRNPGTFFTDWKFYAPSETPEKLGATEGEPADWTQAEVLAPTEPEPWA